MQSIIDKRHLFTWYDRFELLIRLISLNAHSLVTHWPYLTGWWWSDVVELPKWSFQKWNFRLHLKHSVGNFIPNYYWYQQVSFLNSDGNDVSIISAVNIFSIVIRLGITQWVIDRKNLCPTDKNGHVQNESTWEENVSMTEIVANVISDGNIPAAKVKLYESLIFLLWYQFRLSLSNHPRTHFRRPYTTRS